MPRRKRAGKVYRYAEPVVPDGLVVRSITRDEFARMCELACGFEPGTLSPEAWKQRQRAAELRRLESHGAAVDEYFKLQS